ncbi:hypothetical protein B0H13DRAFT_1603908 [Mycena leptocephala]|nr:hypothetical protein B0H13DRAFT_1603908 [Mycena leptocephala]
MTCVLKESPLIQIYSQYCSNIEHNFQLTSFTSRQAAPDMTRTLEQMAPYLQEHGSNEHRAGRNTTYSIPDIITQGVGKMMTRTQGSTEEGGEDEDEDNSELRSAVEPEDLLVDLE